MASRSSSCPSQPLGAKFRGAPRAEGGGTGQAPGGPKHAGAVLFVGGRGPNVRGA